MSRLAIESVLRKYYNPMDFWFLREVSNVSNQAYVIKDDNGVLERIGDPVDIFVFVIIYGGRGHITTTWLHVYLFYYQDDIYCINFNTLSRNGNDDDCIIFYCPIGTSCVYSSKFFVSDDPCETFIGRYNIDHYGWLHHKNKRYVSEFNDYSDDDRYADKTFIDDYSNYSDDCKGSEYSDE